MNIKRVKRKLRFFLFFFIYMLHECEVYGEAFVDWGGGEGKGQVKGCREMQR